MLLIYENLTIRNADEGDAELLSTWWNDGEIMAHAGFPSGTGQTAKSIADSIKNDSDDTGRRLIIEADSIPVGEMSYRGTGDGAAEIGIKICDASKQGKGMGKKLLSMLIFSLFNDLGCGKIVLDTNVTNQRARHVYERIGFKKLRVRENSWTDQLGRPQSCVDYELCQKDFINFAV